ncbi:Predicted arabinose efflux permease, MFS family [Pelagirhabdus alkalitolerans]|uniref:Predicted arabinose efflux permease, MFS family n=2 Tax=Pelagirhabdus alkalitolerans TaxID=1612202 RepID=A0A1G6GJR1_9BACI|nr:Predicted arabinose efflux permease, MFS family [Pelagirhabdus alkalitolerans]
MVQPFLSLYIDSLGNYSDQYVQTASGVIFSITFVAAFIFSPIWGKVGDRIGRKPILVAFAIGLGLSLFLMGFVTNVIQLFFLRLFMGVFTGFISMSEALISTQTSKRVAGQVLGTLQTGTITGTLIGPLIGGTLADLFGYAATFKWLALILFFSGFLVHFGVKEFRVDKSTSHDRVYTSRQVIKHMLRQPLLLFVMFMSMIVQVSNFSIQPILSLFVAELSGASSVAFLSGLAFSAAGLGKLLMAKKWGFIGDKFGYIHIMTLLLFASGLVYLPGGFVTSLWQLVLIRFLLGITLGGIIPLRVAYIRHVAPIEMQGEVLGYNTSLKFFGNMIGPMIGGTISASFGYSAVFVFTGLLLISSGVVMVIGQKRHPELLTQNA